MYSDSTQLVNGRLYQDSYYDTGIVGSIVRYEPQYPGEIEDDDNSYCLWHECPHCGHKLPDNPKYAIGVDNGRLSIDFGVFQCDYCNNEIDEQQVIHHHREILPNCGAIVWHGCPNCHMSMNLINGIIGNDLVIAILGCDYCNHCCLDDEAIPHREEVDEF